MTHVKRLSVHNEQYKRRNTGKSPHQVLESQRAAHLCSPQGQGKAVIDAAHKKQQLEGGEEMRKHLAAADKSKNPKKVYRCHRAGDEDSRQL